MVETDDRKYDITNKVYEVLDDIKGFEIARGEPRTGNMIIRYKGNLYLLELSPLLKEEFEKDYKDADLADIATEFSYVLYGRVI